MVLRPRIPRQDWALVRKQEGRRLRCKRDRASHGQLGVARVCKVRRQALAVQGSRALRRLAFQDEAVLRQASLRAAASLADHLLASSPHPVGVASLRLASRDDERHAFWHETTTPKIR